MNLPIISGLYSFIIYLFLRLIWIPTSSVVANYFRLIFFMCYVNLSYFLIYLFLHLIWTLSILDLHSLCILLICLYSFIIYLFLHPIWTLTISDLHSLCVLFICLNFNLSFPSSSLKVYLIYIIQLYLSSALSLFIWVLLRLRTFHHLCV